MKDICPVCGKYEFDDDYDFCDVCGWCHDRVQEADPDYIAGGNHVSLNQAKKMYSMGRIDKLRTFQAYDDTLDRLDGADAIIASLTPGEMQYIGRVLGDRLFAVSIPSEGDLRDVYSLLKNTRTDSADDDVIRIGLIEKLGKIMVER